MTDKCVLPKALQALDIWSVKNECDVWYFQGRLSGMDDVRGYRFDAASGRILAQTHQQMLVFLAIGGASSALGQDGRARFPYHLVSAADGIGAPGMAGIEEAPRVSFPGPVRERTTLVQCAEQFLARRMSELAALPLIFVRTETDLSPDTAALAIAEAQDNLITAAKNAVAVAQHVGDEAKLGFIEIDYACEDVSSAEGSSWHAGMIDFMDRITKRLHSEVSNLKVVGKPLFLRWAASGIHGCYSDAIFAGQWELDWNHGDHSLVTIGPDYCLDWNQYARLTPEGAQRKATLTTSAFDALTKGEGWQCPRLLLAEWQQNCVKVKAQCQGCLVLDQSDPFGAGSHAGFWLSGVENGASIQSVSLDPEDPQGLVIECNIPPIGNNVTLCYALPGAAQSPCGSLRDDWSDHIVDCPWLRRWALPACLPITGLV